MMFVGTLLVFAPRMEAQGNAPSWQVGNYWNYSGELTGPPVTMNMTMKMYVNGTASVTAGSTSYTTWEVLMWNNMTVSNPPNPTTYLNITGREYFQTTDLALVKTNLTFPNMAPPPAVIVNETTYDPPQKNFKFPLTDALTWSSTSKVNSTENGVPTATSTRTWFYDVSGPHSITIGGLGTFSTFNVTYNESGSATAPQGWFSDTVGNFVRMELPSGTQALTLNLHDYSYVPNQPPTKPTITTSPSTVNKFILVTFTTLSTDPDGDTVSYAWQFGDGTTGTGATAIHSYSALGTFTANVTASDGKGESATNSTTVTVTNRAPGAITITYTPAAPEVNTNVTFGAVAVDLDLDTVTYTWKFGDGATGTGLLVYHTYTAKGTFTVNVTADDGHGGKSYKEMTITIKEKAADNTMMYIVIVLVIVIVIALIAALAMRGRKKRAAQLPPPEQPPVQP